MAKLTTCPAAAELEKLASGEIAPAQLEALAGHVETCPACLAKVQTFSPSDTLIQSLSKARHWPESQDKDMVERLITKLKQLPGGSVVGNTITFTCPCGKTLKTKADLAGKKVKCPACGQLALVPGEASASLAGEQTLAPPGTGRRQEEATIPPAASADTPAPRKPVQPDRTEGLAGDDEDENSLWDFLAPAQQADEIGRLGSYRVLKVLGRGGMGVVFQAEDAGLQRLIALKAMLPSVAASASAKKRFLREARAAAALKHDNVVSIYQVGEDRGAPFLAMEFLHGEPLDDRIKREAVLPLDDVLRIGRQTAEGLAAAHEHGLIHRDIKPGNIWLETRGQGSGIRGQESKLLRPDERLAVSRSSFRVKILDFGLARSAADQTNLTQSGAIIGTPAYMAPEQATGKPVDHRCDLFSLGAMLYRMCTGELPFQGNDTLAILSALAMETPRKPRALNKQVPAELEDLIMRLLAKKPEDRPGSAQEVADALRGMESAADKTSVLPLRQPQRAATGGERDATGELPQPPLPAGRGSGGSRRGVKIAIAAALVGLVAAGIVFFLQTSNGTIRVEILDPTIDVVLAKTGVTIKGANKQGDITVAAGEHLLKIKRGDLEFETDKFILKKGETVALKVEFLHGKVQVALADGRIIGDKRPAAAAALRFDFAEGMQAGLEIPRLRLPAGGPLTLEGFILFHDPAAGGPNPQYFGAQYHLMIGHSHIVGSWWKTPAAAKVGDGQKQVMTSIPQTRAVGVWQHAALVRDGGEYRFYRNGQLTDLIPDKDPLTPADDAKFVIGSLCTGVSLREVRVSNVARYGKEPFKPQERFVPDKHTLALFHLDEGAGQDVRDSSGHAYHGKLPDCARWETMAPTHPTDPDAERRVAQWVLGKKGRLKVQARGAAPMEVTQLDQLPKEAFTIRAVHLASGGNFNADPIANDDLRQLAALVNLDSLDLGRQPITAAGLAHVSGCAELKELFLYAGGIGVDAIPIVAKFTKLETIMFPGDANNDAWAAAVAKMPSIRSVNAYRSDLSDAGVALLAQLPNLMELNVVDAGNVTDAGLRALAACKSLRKLVLTDTVIDTGKMTRAEIARLQKALPDCKITPFDNVAAGPPENKLRGGVERFQLNADGSRLFVYLPFESRVAIIDTATLQTLYEFAGPEAPYITPRPDMRLLAFAHDHAGVHFIPTDGPDKGKKHLVCPSRVAEGHVVNWSPTGAAAFCVFVDGLRLLSPDGFKTTELPKVSGSHLTWSPDGKWLAGFQDKQFRFWKADGTAGPSFEAPDAYGYSGMSSLRWSPDSQWVAFAGRQVTLLSPESKDKRVLGINHEPGDSHTLVRWRPDSQAVMAFNRNGAGWVLPLDGSPMPIPEAPAETRSPGCQAFFLPDGKQMVLRQGDGLKFLEATDKVRARLALPVRHITQMEVLPNGREIVVSFRYPSVDGVLRVYDLQGKLLRSLRGPLLTPEKAAEPPPVLATSAFDKLDRKTIAADELKIAGNGDANMAPPELVAVLGESAWRVGQPVRLLQFSPDGKQLAVGRGKNIVRLDATTGRQLGEIGPATPNLGMTLDRDWTRVAACLPGDGGGSDFRVFDVKSGEVLCKLGDRRGVGVFSQDGKKIIVPGFGIPTQLFDTDSGAPNWKPEGGHSPLGFAAEGKEWVGLTNPGNVALGYLLRVHDTTTGKQLRDLPAAHQGGPRGLSPDGKLIAIPVVGMPSKIRIFDTTTGKQHSELAEEVPDIHGMSTGAFTTDNALFATIASDVVHLWDATTGKPLRRCKLSAGCTHILFSPDGKTLAGGDADGWIRLWDVATGELKNTSTHHAGPVVAVGLNPEGTRLTSIGGDGSLITWEVATVKALNKAGAGKQLQSAAVTRDGQRAVLQAGLDLLLWELGDQPRQIKPYSGAFGGLDQRIRALDAPGKTIAYSGNQGGVFEVAKAKPLPTADSHLRAAVDYAPDGSLLVQAGENRWDQGLPALALVDPLSGQRLAALPEPESYNAAQFHPAGILLAAAGQNKAIRLVDLRTGKINRSIEGHLSPVLHLAWRGDGKWLASLGQDGTLFVHDVAADKETVVKEVQLGEAVQLIRRLAFTPDGRHLVTTNANGTVFVLRLAATP